MVNQPVSGKPYKKPTITVKGQRLQVVDKLIMKTVPGLAKLVQHLADYVRVFEIEMESD